MDAEEILDLLANPNFIRLENVRGGWEITYRAATAGKEVAIRGDTLDDLLARFAVILEEGGGHE